MVAFAGEHTSDILPSSRHSDNKLNISWTSVEHQTTKGVVFESKWFQGWFRCNDGGLGWHCPVRCLVLHSVTRNSTFWMFWVPAFSAPFVPTEFFQGVNSPRRSSLWNFIAGNWALASRDWARRMRTAVYCHSCRWRMVLPRQHPWEHSHLRPWCRGSALPEIRDKAQIWWTSNRDANTHCSTSSSKENFRSYALELWVSINGYPQSASILDWDFPVHKNQPASLGYPHDMDWEASARWPMSWCWCCTDTPCRMPWWPIQKPARPFWPSLVTVVPRVARWICWPTGGRHCQWNLEKEDWMSRFWRCESINWVL